MFLTDFNKTAKILTHAAVVNLVTLHFGHVADANGLKRYFDRLEKTLNFVCVEVYKLCQTAKQDRGPTCDWKAIRHSRNKHISLIFM